MRAAAALALAALALALATVAGPARAEGDDHAITAAVDLSVVVADSPLDSWLEGGNGKLRFDDDHDGLVFSRAFIDYRGRIAPTPWSTPWTTSPAAST